MLFAYLGYSDATVTFQISASAESLHSNRGYEVGMVYMDDFNRASTAQVSPCKWAQLTYLAVYPLQEIVFR